MSAHRFTFTLDGTTYAGLMFESETALEAFLAQRNITLVTGSVAPPASRPAPEEPRPRGRPSLDAVLAAAVAELGPSLDPAASLADRARAVMRHIAETRGAEEIPARRTVETFLAAQPARNNSRRKSRRKSHAA